LLLGRYLQINISFSFSYLNALRLPIPMVGSKLLNLPGWQQFRLWESGNKS